RFANSPPPSSIWFRSAAISAKSCPRPIPATTSARTKPFSCARWRMAAKASILPATIARRCPHCGGCSEVAPPMTTAEILAAFPTLRVLVAGDVCLDRWCTYDPALALPSAETGIPRTAVVSTEVTPGAAGTVANNLAALGAGRVDVLGMVGDDGFGYELRRALSARGISGDLLVEARGIPTFTYTKLISRDTEEEDRPRLDFVYTQNPPESVESEVVARFQRVAGDYDVVLVSDQAETERGGVVTPRVRDAVSKAARETLVWVDSRQRPEHFR